MSTKVLLSLAVVLVAHGIAGAAPLVIPASTAYTHPDPNGARVSIAGISGWKDAAVKILWFGELKSAGALDAGLQLRLAPNTTSKLRLTIDGQAREAEVTGGSDIVTASFGKFNIREPGYKRFTLEALNDNPPFGDPIAFVLDGDAVAHRTPCRPTRRP